jgi:hypothetical protein
VSSSMSVASVVRKTPVYTSGQRRPEELTAEEMRDKLLSYGTEGIPSGLVPVLARRFSRRRRH